MAIAGRTLRFYCAFALFPIGFASAQEIRPFSVPIPPLFADGARPDLRLLQYDPSKSASENNDVRAEIERRLQDTQARLKQLESAVTFNRATGGPLSESGSTVVQPREALVREVRALQWRLTAFNREALCGPSDNSQDVELYDGKLGPSKDFVKTRQPSTGQIRWNVNIASALNPDDNPGDVSGQRWCSGTLISERLFITAGHCFEIDLNGWQTPQRKVGNGFISLPPQELAPLMHVIFNYQRDGAACGNPAFPATCPIRGGDVYPILKLVERGNEGRGLDYAILELGDGKDGLAPGQKYAPQLYDVSEPTLRAAAQLTVIQHPNGKPKRVAAGTSLRISDDHIYYTDLDTLGGSSGAGILTQSERLIGIHTDGGCDGARRENFGLSLLAIARVSKVVK